MDQIRGWQTARTKLPSWADCDDIIYPPHISMEQCSSEQTAIYKQRLAQRLLTDVGIEASTDGTLIDLTGGFGVDFSFMAQGFANAIYTERQQHLCNIATHNLHQLGIKQADVRYVDAEDLLNELPARAASLIFIDPARRSSTGSRTYAISDCTPDVCTLMPRMLEVAPVVIVKLSPMLDWHEAVRLLPGVTEIHIVSVRNECKELLVCCSALASKHRSEDGTQDAVKVFCVNDSDVFSFSTSDSTTGLQLDKEHSSQYNYLLLPNASVMKAGCYGLLARQFGATEASVSSHIFFCDYLPECFPGKSYHILASSTMNKRELKAAIKEVEDLTGEALKNANISVRNFPLSAVQLRQRLKLDDGGNIHIFGTTMHDGEHRLYFTRL